MKSIKPTRAIAGAIAAATIVVLSACAGVDSDTPGDSGTGSTLTVAMTAAQIPLTDSRPTQGGEGYRFVGYQIYDALIGYDLSDPDVLAPLAPGLATEWSVDEADTTKWTFTLREGVKFHDGTDFNAEAAVFAFDRILDPEFEFYSEETAAGSTSYVNSIASYRAIDDYTLEIVTKTPNSLLPYSMTSVLFPSPAAVEEWGNDEYAAHPVGTGPFVFVEQNGQESLTLAKNPDYWAGAANIDTLVLKPMPEASSRLAALLAGEVNWAEVPPPDSLATLEAEGFTLHSNYIPFVWELTMNNMVEPLSDVRVRQALNYAIDRDSMIENILHGTAMASTGPVYKGHPWYPEGATEYTYDPEKAKDLLTEAGYPDGLTLAVQYPQSGSGNMLPQPMMEFIQANLAEIGVTLDMQTIEWTNMQSTYRAGMPEGVDMLEYAWTTSSPQWIYQFFHSSQLAPAGLNPGGYSNPEVDALLDQMLASFDPAEQDALLKQAMKYVQEDAPWLFVVHDLNSRVTKGVEGLVMAQASYVDLTKVSVTE